MLISGFWATVGGECWDRQDGEWGVRSEEWEGRVLSSQYSVSDTWPLIWHCCVTASFVAVIGRYLDSILLLSCQCLPRLLAVNRVIWECQMSWYDSPLGDNCVAHICECAAPVKHGSLTALRGYKWFEESSITADSQSHSDMPQMGFCHNQSDETSSVSFPLIAHNYVWCGHLCSPTVLIQLVARHLTCLHTGRSSLDSPKTLLSPYIILDGRNANFKQISCSENGLILLPSHCVVTLLRLVSPSHIQQTELV